MSKGKILVMDDEKFLLEVVCSMLDMMEYDVEDAAEGLEAVEKYKKAKDSGAPFDLLILDINVPNGIGAKATLEKLIEIDPDVKAIVTSGDPTDTVMENYKDNGFAGSLSKPFKVEEMEQALQDVLG